jgi:peptide/nickel transport system permease protein
LWAIPTLFGISLVAFLLTTLIPEPPPESLESQLAMLERDPASFDAYEESRRERNLDLPRFVNTQPRDVRTIANESMNHLIKGDAQAPIAAHRLSRIGGALLPFIVPELDRLEPQARSRVALALAPIGDRMGFSDDARLRDPSAAAAYWTQFWQDRAIEFTGPAVVRAVARISQRSTDVRERDLQSLDTFALPQLVDAMKTENDPEAIGRLAAMASSVSGRDAKVPAGASTEQAKAVAHGWVAWWDTHRTDYTVIDGGERVAASLSDTRYGKWLLSAGTGEFGISVRDGTPIFKKLLATAPITIGLTLVSLLMSFCVGVPLGAISGWRRGRRIDVRITGLLFFFYALPTFFLAQLLLHALPEASGTTRLVLAMITMTLGSLASVSRFQRASLLDVLSTDYVRTARAKGAPAWRVLVVHAARNAIIPTVTLAGLQLPVLFGAASRRCVRSKPTTLRGSSWRCSSPRSQRWWGFSSATSFTRCSIRASASACSGVRCGRDRGPRPQE